MIIKKWLEERKLAREISKQIQNRVAEEYAKSLRYNELLKTDNFAEVIKELMQQVSSGFDVTITLNNGHKIEITKQNPNLPRDFNSPYF